MMPDNVTYATPKPEPSTADIRRNILRTLKKFDDMIAARKETKEAYYRRHMYAEWHEPTENDDAN